MLGAELRINENKAMNALLRKYSSGVITLVVYVAIIGFALACSFDLV